MPQTPSARWRRQLDGRLGRAAEPSSRASLEDVYPLELYFYEVSPAPLLDLLIAAPQPADAH